MKKRVKLAYLLLIAMILTSCGSVSSEAEVKQSEVVASEIVQPEIVQQDGEAKTSLQNGRGRTSGALRQTEVKESKTANVEGSTKDVILEMEVHFIDVGQADATLIKCGDQAMLIDTAESSKGTTLQKYLTKQGITKLDYLVLTHPDADHIGGAPVIITKFEIDRVFMSNFAKDNLTYQKLIQALDNKSLKWSTPSVGSTYSLGSAKVTIIAPNKEYSDPNNASISLLIENGNTSFIFTGDAEEEAENDIAQNGINIEADVYHVGHHGSDTASSEALLDVVKPTYAVISCEEGNSYGHPHAQPLNYLRTRGVLIFRTDEQGSIIATADGEKITWNCAPSESWQAGERTESSTKASQTNEVKTSETKTINTTEDNKSLEVHITKTGAKYHQAGCQYLNKSDIITTLDLAKSKGLTPCSKCW